MGLFRAAWEKIKGFVVGVDHAVILVLEVLRHEFTGEQIRHAIDVTLQAADKFVTTGLDEYEAAVVNTQKNEWVVGTLQADLHLSPTAARALTSSAVLWIEKGVHRAIQALDSHFQNDATTAGVEQAAGTGEVR
jgi:hypothetical protein